MARDEAGIATGCLLAVAMTIVISVLFVAFGFWVWNTVEITQVPTN